MVKINKGLLDAIRKKTGLSQGAIYGRIKHTADSELLPRHLAAIKVGADVGVTINKYARPEELAQLRQAGTPVTPPPVVQAAQSGVSQQRVIVREKKAKKPAKKTAKKTANQVFVVYGRDSVAKAGIFAFLRAIGVKPIEWNGALAMTKKAAPYIGEVLSAAFAQARAVVVLLTPDDLAQLRSELVSPGDKPYERTLTGQARPNVLFEAGMAFATHPDRTVLVQLGTVREFSDVAGRHVVHLNSDYDRRRELATKLQNAGCDVDVSGSDWVHVGDFSDPLSRAPKRVPKKRAKRQ